MRIRVSTWPFEPLPTHTDGHPRLGGQECRSAASQATSRSSHLVWSRLPNVATLAIASGRPGVYDGIRWIHSPKRNWMRPMSSVNREMTMFP